MPVSLAHISVGVGVNSQNWSLAVVLQVTDNQAGNGDFSGATFLGYCNIDAQLVTSFLAAWLGG